MPIVDLLAISNTHFQEPILSNFKVQDPNDKTANISEIPA